MEVSEGEIQLLRDLPPMTDTIQLQVQEILMSIFSAVYFTRPDLIPAIVVTAIWLSTLHGVCTTGAYAFVAYALSLPISQARVKFAAGRLGFHFIQNHLNKAVACPIHKVFASHIQCWVEPVAETIPLLKKAIDIGKKTYNVEYTVGPSCLRPATQMAECHNRAMLLQSTCATAFWRTLFSSSLWLLSILHLSIFVAASRLPTSWSWRTSMML